MLGGKIHSDNMIARTVPTPHSNTGSNRQSPHGGITDAHLDYLVVCGSGDIEELLMAIRAVFGTCFDFEKAYPGTRGRYYATILKSSQGIELAYDSDSPNLQQRVFRLSIPGLPLSHVRPEELHKLGRYLIRLGVRCTRFDWAIDDWSRSLPLDSIEEACAVGNYTGARTYRIIRSAGRQQQKLGRSIYFGSPQSDKQVRIYDKEVESGGEVPTIRYEVQWRDELAHHAFSQYFSQSLSPDNIGGLSNLALGAIGFIDRISEVAARCPLLSWWADFLELLSASPVKLSVRRIQPMVSSKWRWMERQVAGTVALLTACCGFDDTFNRLERLVREKLAHLSSSARSFIQTYYDRQNMECATFEDIMSISAWDC
jgi:DNA relaxase NicK